MRTSQLLLFQTTAGIVAGYHVLLGLLGLAGPSDWIARAADLALGVQIEPQGQVLLFARFAGAYLLAFGVMMLLVAIRPQKYRALVLPALVLFGTRAVVRLVRFNSLSEEMGMPAAGNVVGIALLILFFVLLLVTRPRVTAS